VNRISAKRVILFILLAVIVGFITYWGISIARYEILTLNHKKEFVGLELQTNMLTQAKTLKVLNYSAEMATVYYKDESGTLYFSRSRPSDRPIFHSNKGRWW
jgi:hypothetical protein